MSNNHLFMKSGFPRANLQNGVGRYVCQLQIITLKYCKSMGCSKGVRDFLENQLLEFSTKNPGVVVYVKPRRHRQPVIVAEYLNGDRHWFNVRGFTEEQLAKWIDLMRTQNANTSAIRMRKLWHTDCPSIQGAWTPYTHKHPEMNTATFPDKKFSRPLDVKPTATDQLLEMFERSKLQDEEKTEKKKIEKDENGENMEAKEVVQ